MAKNDRRGFSTFSREFEAEVAEGTESEIIGGLRGLETFPEKIETIENYVKPYLLEPVLTNLHGWIEEYGTGGSSFRVFTRDFLISAYEKTNDPNLPQAILLLGDAIADWHDLSLEFKAAGTTVKEMKDPEERKALYGKVANRARILYNSEQALYLYLKEISR